MLMAVRAGLHCQLRWDYHPCTLMAEGGASLSRWDYHHVHCGPVTLMATSQGSGASLSSKVGVPSMYTDGSVRAGLHCQSRWDYHPCTLMAQSGRGFTVN